MEKKISSTKFEQEKMDLFHFISDRVAKREGGILLTQDAFLAYQGWRKFNKLEETALSADGFGKIFPHAYQRKVFRINLGNGQLRWARGYSGVVLV